MKMNNQKGFHSPSIKGSIEYLVHLPDINICYLAGYPAKLLAGYPVAGYPA